MCLHKNSHLFSGYSEWGKFEVDVLCGNGTRSRIRECFYINQTIHDIPMSHEVCKQLLGEWKEEEPYDTGKPCRGKIL